MPDGVEPAAVSTAAPVRSRRPRRRSVAVVIPAYRVADRVADVIARVPALVTHIIVVDDGSPDGVADRVAELGDPRLVVVRHAENRGVGAAVKTGWAKALELGADVIVKVDGDGQMDPALLPKFVAPIAAGAADLTKGNRFFDLAFVGEMPLVRRLGNLALSFLVKVASGYWRVFDPCNGYVAVRADLVRRLNRARLADRYFFEISLLCEAYLAGAVLREVPMRPVYDGAPSALSPAGSVVEFTPRLAARAAYRVLVTYFMRDFGVVSVLLLAGVPSLVFGVAWSAAHWVRSVQSQTPATTGTVIIGLLAIVAGFQLLLQAVVLDVGNEPRSRG